MGPFEVKSFDELTTRELFSIYRLRVAVFVVEQECYYQEVDDDDLISLHVFAKDTDGHVVAYARLIPETEQKAVRIGRVVVSSAARKDGFGRALVTETLRQAKSHFPEATQVFAQAQAYLQKFYESYGFEAKSDVYLEDGIPHLDMALAVTKIG